MQSSKTKSIRPAVFALLISILYVLSMAPLIALSPVGGSSEAREIHVASAIFESNEWILPRRNGLVPSKPPFFHWCAALLGTVFGRVDEFVVRLTALIFAGATLFITMLTGARLFSRVALPGLCATSPNSAALGAAAVLTTSYMFVQMSGDARVDMAFSFFTVAAISSILLPLTTRREQHSKTLIPYRNNDFLVFYAAAAFAVLCKGPLGIVLPLAIGLSVSFYMFGLKSGLKVWLRPRPSWLIFLLLVCTWYFLAYLRGGEGFIGRQIIFENLRRFSGGDKVNVEAWWYYLPAFVRAVFPWSFIFIGLLISCLRRKALKTLPYPKTNAPQDYFNLLIIWFFCGFILFSAAAGKRNSYLLPLLPAVAVYLSWSFCTSSWKFVSSIKMRLLPILSLLFSLVWLALEIFVLSKLGGPVFVQEAKQFFLSKILIFELLLALPIFCFVVKQIFLPASAPARDILTVTSAWFLLGLVSFSGLALKNNLRKFDLAAAEINSLVAQQEKIIVIRELHEELMDPLLYYLKRPVIISSLDKTVLECGTHYLFEDRYKSLVTNMEASAPGKFVVRAEFIQPIDKEKGNHNRTLHLLRYNCKPHLLP